MKGDNKDLSRIDTAMTDKIRETLSAMYDGQAESFEARRALAEVEKSPELADDWQRFSLISDALREQGAQPQVDLSGSIMAHIQGAEAPTEHSAAPKQGGVARKWFAQAAVAAGVAFTLMLGLNVSQPDAPVAQVAVQSDIDFTPSTAPNPLALQASTIGRTAEQSPAMQALQAQLQTEIQAYMIRHAEHAAASGQQGLLPLARVMDNDQESP